jgi:DNA polymerase-3 subunit gamma/tau
VAYEVLARKWRPQQFDDVVGQAHVTETLKNAITSNRLAHAYLFVGPRGIGKTSIARILAKALNCAKGSTTVPCDKCDSCLEIMDSRSLDVLEIDGASNNSVDQVRELRDTVKYLPTRGPFKIYIIDEVHMLTQQAFNALLKTLEEPPAHVKFVFATTEPQKILATILSRCQRFDLRRIPNSLLVSRLAEIAKAEGVSVTDDALLAIARGSEGGLRDAESALDQLISFRGKDIGEEDVLAVFGLVSRRALTDLVDAVLGGDVPAVIRIVAELDAEGKDMQRLVVDLLSHVRDLLVCAYSGESAAELNVTDIELDVLQRQSGKVSPERLLSIADILAETDSKLRYALSKRTLLEMALVRSARAATVVSIDEILERINKLRSAGVGAARRESAQPAAAAVKDAEPMSPEDELAWLHERWHEVVDKVGKSAPLAKAALLDASPVAVSDTDVTIGFDPEFAEHMKRMYVKRNANALRGVLKNVLQRDVAVQLTVMSGDGRTLLPTDIVPSEEEENNDSPEDDKRGSRKRRSVQEWLQNEAVRKTVEAFDGEIVDIRE